MKKKLILVIVLMVMSIEFINIIVLSGTISYAQNYDIHSLDTKEKLENASESATTTTTESEVGSGGVINTTEESESSSEGTITKESDKEQDSSLTETEESEQDDSLINDIEEVDGAVQVSNWKALLNAASKNASHIELTANILADTNTPVVFNDDTTIVGNNYKIDFGAYQLASIKIANNKTITFSDVSFNKTVTNGGTNDIRAQMITGKDNPNDYRNDTSTGKVVLTGDITFLPTYQVGFIALGEGSIEMLNANINVISSANKNMSDYLFISKNLNIVDSKVFIDQAQSTGNQYAAFFSKMESNMTIDNSTVDILMNGTSNSERGMAIGTTGVTNFHLTNGSKMTVSGEWNDGVGSNRLGLVTFSKQFYTGNQIVVDKQSSFEITNRKGTAFAQTTTNSNLIIDNASFLINGNSNRPSPLIKYAGGDKGSHNTFNIKNNGELVTRNTLIEGVGNFPNIVEFYGDGNDFIVESGGKLDLDNTLFDKLQTNGDSSRRTANIRFNGGNNSFIIKDGTGLESNEIGRRTEVVLTSDARQVIYQNGKGLLTVVQSPNTIFIAAGMDDGKNGIFKTDGTMDFSITAPYFYDFRNNRVGGGLIYGTSEGSSLKITNTAFSAWKYTDRMNGTASFNLQNRGIVSYQGKNFGAIGPDMDKEFGRILPSLSDGTAKRISANNAAPAIKGIRTPTNADKRYIAQFVIPEGNANQYLLPSTGDTHVAVEELKPNGESIIHTTSTIGFNPEAGDEGVQTWEEKIAGIPASAGRIELIFPDYIEKGTKFKIKDVWRGEQDPNSLDAIHASIKNIDDSLEAETVDVMPPKLVNFASDISLDTQTKVIKALPNPDNIPGNIVVLYVNGAKVNEQEVSADGSFIINLDKPLIENDVVQISMLNHVGSIIDDTSTLSSKFSTPATNNSVGNFNPIPEDYAYHDAVFTMAKKYTVKMFEGALTLVSIPNEISFASPQRLSKDKKTYFLNNIDGQLIVEDTRTSKTDWALYAKIIEPFKSQGNPNYLSSDYFKYIYNGSIQSFKEGASVKIYDNNGSDGGTKNISDTWQEDVSGFAVELPPGVAKPGEYKTNLNWELRNVPTND